MIARHAVSDGTFSREMALERRRSGSYSASAARAGNRVAPFWSVAPKHLSALLHICPEPNPDFPVLCMVGTQGNIVVGRNYLARQAGTLLRFAQSTKNPQLAAALIEKAADLKSQVDDQEPASESSAVAPDVERPS